MVVVVLVVVEQVLLVEGGEEVGIDVVVRSITLLISSPDANEKDVRIRLGTRFKGTASHSRPLFLEVATVGKLNVQGDVVVETVRRGVGLEGVMEVDVGGGSISIEAKRA